MWWRCRRGCLRRSRHFHHPLQLSIFTLLLTLPLLLDGWATRLVQLFRLDQPLQKARDAKQRQTDMTLPSPRPTEREHARTQKVDECQQRSMEGIPFGDGGHTRTGDSHTVGCWCTACCKSRRGTHDSFPGCRSQLPLSSRRFPVCMHRTNLNLLGEAEHESEEAQLLLATLVCQLNLHFHLPALEVLGIGHFLHLFVLPEAHRVSLQDHRHWLEAA